MITRRAAILGMGTGIGLFAAIDASKAQHRDPEVENILADAESNARDLLDYVTESTDEIDSVKLASVADPVEENVSAAVKAATAEGNDKALRYVRSSEQDLAHEMLLHDVPLGPEQKFEFSPGPVEPDDPSEKEELGSVIIDVFFQTFLDRSINYGAFKGALMSLGVGEDFTALQAAVRGREWRKVATIFKKMLVVLTGKKALALLEERIGAQATRRMLVYVGARGVPFIGWAFTLASFIQALRDNWDRLERAV